MSDPAGSQTLRHLPHMMQQRCKSTISKAQLQPFPGRSPMSYFGLTLTERSNLRGWTRTRPTNTETTVIKLKRSWSNLSERVLNNHLSNDTKMKPLLWKCIFKSRRRWIQFSVFRPGKIYRFNQNIILLCFRCGLEEGTFSSIPTAVWWIGDFWQNIKVLSGIHAITSPSVTEECLLGNISHPNWERSNSSLQRIFCYCNCRQVSFTKWKSDKTVKHEKNTLHNKMRNIGQSLETCKVIYLQWLSYSLITALHNSDTL